MSQSDISQRGGTVQAVKGAAQLFSQACTLTHVSIYESLHTDDVSLLIRLQESWELTEHQVRGPVTRAAASPSTRRSCTSSLVFHSSVLIWGLCALALSCASTHARCGEAERMCKSDIKHARFPSWGRAATAEGFCQLANRVTALQKRAALQLHNGPRRHSCKMQAILRWKVLITWQKGLACGGAENRGEAFQAGWLTTRFSSWHL